MFPLHQIHELSFKISPSPYQQQATIKQDHTLDLAALNKSNLKNAKRKSCRSLFSRDQGDKDDNRNDEKARKMIHRDTERHRRQDMASLYSSLRLLLPLEYIKGKRSIADHTNQAINYIKHLEEKIKKLGMKRNELKELSNLSDVDPRSQNKNIYNLLKIHPCCGGVEIVISKALREEGLPLSRVVAILLGERLGVVSCVSAKVNEKLIYTIRSEVSNMACVDLSELQWKLADALHSSRG